MALSPHEAFRRAVRDLSISAKADLATVFRGAPDPRAAEAALREILPDVVSAYGDMAASLAADYYETVREAAGVKGRFSPVVGSTPDPGTDGLVRYALGTAKDGDTFRSLVEGGVQLRIANAGRDVVTRSSIADPRARGWMRVGGGGCDFCAMLISRGSVYSESSVDFAAHDHCSCGAAPAFDESQVRDVKAEFVQSARRKIGPNGTLPISDADRERVNGWIADHL